MKSRMLKTIFKSVLFVVLSASVFAVDNANIDEQLSMDVITETAISGSKEEFLKLAKEAEKAGNVSTAIDNYKKYLKLDEYGDGAAVFSLGDIYFKSSLYEYAMTTFERDKSGSWKNNFGAATCARFLGYYKKAINNYLKVTAAKPNFEEGYLGLAISYQLSTDFPNSIIYFKKYLEYQKKEEIYITMVNILIKTEKKDEAKAIVEEGLTFFPDSQNLRDLSAIVYR